jgi:hypothetical protein
MEHDPEKWKPLFSEKIMLEQRDVIMMRFQQNRVMISLGRKP